LDVLKRWIQSLPIRVGKSLDEVKGLCRGNFIVTAFALRPYFYEKMHPDAGLEVDKLSVQYFGKFIKVKGVINGFLNQSSIFVNDDMIKSFFIDVFWLNEALIMPKRQRMHFADKSREVQERSVGVFMEIEVDLISKEQSARREDMTESHNRDFAAGFGRKVELLELKMIVRVKVLVEKIGSISFEFVKSLVLMFGRRFLLPD
jgi:hypothetical protein